MSQPVSRCQSNSCFSKSLAIEVLSKAEPISHLATQHQVSRKFSINKATKQEALDEVFSSSNNEQAVLFYVPVTQTWLFQLNKSVNPLCHCAGVVELLRDAIFPSVWEQSIIVFRWLLSKQQQLTSPKICLIFAWGYTMKFSKAATRLGEWMLAPLTAIY